MNHLPEESPTVEKKTPDRPSEPEARAPSGPAKVAKIRCLDSVKARGFTFAKGKVVDGVSFELAKLLKEDGKAEILDVTTL